MFKSLFGSKRQSAKKRPARNAPPQPNHVKGNPEGNTLAREKGKEPGRGEKGRKSYRTARDSTSIDPDARDPIHPDSPAIPPA